MNIRFSNVAGTTRNNVFSSAGSTGSKSQVSFDKMLANSAKEKNARNKNGTTIQGPGVSIELHTQGTYQQRLDAISKLNAETDWDSLSDVEKVRIFEDRYKEAFPDYDSISAGIYADFSDEHNAIQDHCIYEFNKYIPFGGSEFNYNYREAYYPNMTNEEVRSSIREKYEKTGCMEEKMLVLEEYIRCGLDTGIESSMLMDLNRQLREQTCKKYGSSMIGDQRNPRYLSGLISYAKGIGDGANYRPNWTQLTQNMMQFKKDHGRYSKDELQEIQSSLDQFLNDLIK